jgi:hypothetical protein
MVLSGPGGIWAWGSHDWQPSQTLIPKEPARRLRSETRMERKSLKTNKPQKRRNETDVNPLKRNDHAKSLIRSQ